MRLQLRVVVRKVCLSVPVVHVGVTYNQDVKNFEKDVNNMIVERHLSVVEFEQFIYLVF